MSMVLRERSRRLVDQLRSTALPWWVGTLDERCGGYLLSPDEKQLATQSRMVWTFAHAHRVRLGDYLGVAEQGLAFLLARFRDPKHGGFFWKTDRFGNVRSDRKILYGQLFVVHALVEYARASRDAGVLDEAQTLFELIVERAHDDVYGGWLEHFSRSWRPSRWRKRGFEVEIPGLKSANTHLHALEALAELYADTGDAAVEALLAETVDVSTTHFFPVDPAASVQHCRRNWRPAGRPGVSHGHNIEFAWLLVRADHVLGRESSRSRYDAYVSAMLTADRPTRIWWEEAELLAALATGLAEWPNAAREEALEEHLGFILDHVVDPEEGIWLHTVGAKGEPLSTVKRETWKDAYHEVRAITLLAETLAGKNLPH
jgi:mannose/cellobiose epimerase-like protein (N-acyl-D-glucosamine 2-epimerase family)